MTLITKEKVITRLVYNWMPAMSDGKEIYSDDYKEYLVGINGVVSIKEHMAKGDGDKWYYDVEFEGGLFERIFNPNSVSFTLKEIQETYEHKQLNHENQIPSHTRQY